MANSDKIVRNGKLAGAFIVVSSPLARILKHTPADFRYFVWVAGILLICECVAVYFVFRFYVSMRKAGAAARRQITTFKSKQNEIKDMRDRYLELLRESARLSGEASSLQREAHSTCLQIATPLVARAKQLMLDAEQLRSEIATRPEAAREASEKSRQAIALYREVSDMYRDQAPSTAARDLTSKAKAISAEAEKLEHSPQFEKLSNCVAEQQRAMRESMEAYRAACGIGQSADST